MDFRTVRIKRKKFYDDFTAYGNQETGNFYHWKISIVTLEARHVDMVEFMIGLDEENVTEMVKLSLSFWEVLISWLATRFQKGW